jgi:hypothetical protein
VQGLERRIGELTTQTDKYSDVLRRQLMESEEAKNRVNYLEKTLRTFE